MHRLTVLFHHIICNINNIVDWTDALCAKPLLHPLRRRSDLDIFHDSCRISGTQIRIEHGYLDIIIDIFAVSGFFYDRRNKFFSEGCSRLARDSEHRETVHTV